MQKNYNFILSLFTMVAFLFLAACTNPVASNTESSDRLSPEVELIGNSNNLTSRGSILLTVELENASIVDGKTESKNSGYSGTGYANTDNKDGMYIEFPVNITSAGSYTLDFRFALPSGNRYGSIQVNGTTVVSKIDFNSTGSWTDWANSSAVVELKAGSNTIRLTAEQSGGLANMDKVDITGDQQSSSSSSSTSSTPSSSSSSTSSASSSTSSSSSSNNGDSASGVVGWATVNGGCTGGGNATAQRVTSMSELRTLAGDSTPRVLELSGTFSTGSSALVIKSNKTIIGLGNSTTIKGGIQISSSKNIIIRNLHILGAGKGKKPSDAIGVSGSSNIWFDHLAVSDASDGILDLTRGTDHCTVSWCKFFYTDSSNTHRLALLFGGGSTHGSTDTGKNNHTIHHNWFGELVDQRMPRLLFGKGHIYNNYFNAPGNEYCVGSGSWASLLIENNYFENVNDPHRFQDKNPSYITAKGNIYKNCKGKTDTGAGGSGSNPPGAWTNPPYAYTLDAAADVPALVKKYAGPQ